MHEYVLLLYVCVGVVGVVGGGGGESGWRGRREWVSRVYVCVEFEVYMILNWNSRKTPHFIPKF